MLELVLVDLALLALVSALPGRRAADRRVDRRAAKDLLRAARPERAARPALVVPALGLALLAFLGPALLGDAGAKPDAGAAGGGERGSRVTSDSGAVELQLPPRAGFLKET